jgi:RAP1 GTPase activating protein 1
MQQQPPLDEAQMRQDLARTPKWVIASLRAARLEGAQWKEECERLKAVWESERATLSADMQGYALRVEQWKAAVLAKSAEEVRAKDSQIVELQRAISDFEKKLTASNSRLEQARLEAAADHDHSATALSDEKVVELVKQFRAIRAQRDAYQSKISKAKEFFEQLQRTKQREDDENERRFEQQERTIERHSDRIETLQDQVASLREQLRANLAAAASGQKKRQKRAKRSSSASSSADNGKGLGASVSSSVIDSSTAPLPVGGRRLSAAGGGANAAAAAAAAAAASNAAAVSTSLSPTALAALRGQVSSPRVLSSRGSRLALRSRDSRDSLDEVRELVASVLNERGEELKLDGHTLASLPSAIFELQWLSVLDLSNNLLTTLPRELAQLGLLEELYLQNNRLAELPEFLPEACPQLMVLDVNGNYLRTLPECVRNFQMLQVLDCAYNKFSALPEALTRIESLQVLDISRNELAALPPSICELDQLSELFLAGNRIEQLPPIRAGALPNLIVVDLSNNAIAALPPSIAVLGNSVQELQLDNNPLTYPPKEVVDGGLHEIFAFLAAEERGETYVVGAATQQRLAMRIPHPTASLEAIDIAAMRKRAGSSASVPSSPLTVRIVSAGQSPSTTSASPLSAGADNAADGVNASNNGDEDDGGDDNFENYSVYDDSTASDEHLSTAADMSPPLTPQLPSMGGGGGGGGDLSKDDNNNNNDDGLSSKPLTLANESVALSSVWRLIKPIAELTLDDAFADDNVKLVDGTSFADYERYFFNNQHVNFFGTLPKTGSKVSPVALSILHRIPTEGEGDQFYRVLIRTQDRDERLELPASSVRKANKKATYAREKDLIRALHTQRPDLSPLKFVALPAHSSTHEFLALEEDMVLRSYKIGVLLVRADQPTDENAWFANEHATPQFTQFLEILGERVHLEGWAHFAGGLDTSGGSTGEHSYYTRLDSYEVMFHVSTMLPRSAADVQQIERKRHIGNDIVVIVFLEHGADVFRPDVLTSIFNHVYIVVRVVGVNAEGVARTYHISVLAKPGVDAAEHALPELPSPPIVAATRDLRDLLLKKCINMERAAYAAPGFAPAIRRTRRQLLIQSFQLLDPRSKSSTSSSSSSSSSSSASLASSSSSSSSSSSTNNKRLFAKIFGD